MPNPNWDPKVLYALISPPSPAVTMTCCGFHTVTPMEGEEAEKQRERGGISEGEGEEREGVCIGSVQIKPK